MAGRVLDVQGKPIAGVFVEIERKRGHGPDLRGARPGVRLRRRSDGRRRPTPTGGSPSPRCPRGNTASLPSETNYDGDRKVQLDPPAIARGLRPHEADDQGGRDPRPAGDPRLALGRDRGALGRQQGAAQGRAGAASSSARSTARSGSPRPTPIAQGRFSVKVPHGLEEVQLDIIDQRARLDAAPDRQGRAAGRGPHGQAGHARPRRQGDRDRPVRRADHRHQRHDEGRPADQGFQGDRRVHRARPG